MSMYEIEKMFEEVSAIPFSELNGKNVFTIGTRFWGLNSREFRKLLSAAGVNINKYPKKSTDIIIVGNNPSKSSIINILLKFSDKNRAPFVKATPFFVRFFPELKDIVIKHGFTLREYLIDIYGLKNDRGIFNQ
jgi:hypothetical protein